MKKIKNSILYVLAIGVTFAAIYLVLDKYVIRLGEFFQYILIILAVSYIYIFVHECIHLLIAYMFDMKIVFLKFFNLMFLFDGKTVKKYKDKDFNGAGNSLAFPTWRNTSKQWLVYLIVPYIFTFIATGMLFFTNMNYTCDNIVFNCMVYMGIFYCLWCIIPIKGSDLYYAWIYILKRSQFDAIYNTLVLNYALIYSDMNYEKYFMMKIPNLRLESEVMQDWLFSSLKYDIDLILMGKYRESKNMKAFYGDSFVYFSLGCKIVYAIYVYFLTGNDEVWRNNIQDVKEPYMYEYCFGRLLIESDVDINLMIDQFDNEIHKYENIGIKDAYKLEKELYTAMVRRTITKNRKERI
ncbi:MAG: hypothetical protein HFG28_10305 [Eubacterium sp.]|nr:hypothetical protein [Eubacterium sp.]